jgi:hypothetical protein
MSDSCHGSSRAKRWRLFGSSRNDRTHTLTIVALVIAATSLAASRVIAQDQWSSVPSPCDFVTSGGFVITDSGKKANFAVHGGCKNGEFWGHLNFMDHTTGYTIDSIGITGFLAPVPGALTRDICGLATTNRDEPQPVWFRVRLSDIAEPGTWDEFGLRLSTGYIVTTRALNAGKTGGGNVQVHDPNPSTVAPFPPPDDIVMCNGVAEPSMVNHPE